MKKENYRPYGRITEVIATIEGTHYDEMPEMVKISLFQARKKLEDVRFYLRDNDANISCFGIIQTVLILLYGAMASPNISLYDRRVIFDVTSILHGLVGEILF